MPPMTSVSSRSLKSLAVLVLDVVALPIAVALAVERVGRIVARAVGRVVTEFPSTTASSPARSGQPDRQGLRSSGRSRASDPSSSKPSASWSRDPPYILQVELARGRLLRINHKLEEWGLLDYEGTEEIAARIGEARENLILAINEDHPAKAAALGEKALALAIHASEEISRFYAQGMIARRAQAGNLARKLFGCSIPWIRRPKPPRSGSPRPLTSFQFP